jgi:hypothetical protein
MFGKYVPNFLTKDKIEILEGGKRKLPPKYVQMNSFNKKKAQKHSKSFA